jgi:hypothetical protein
MPNSNASGDWTAPPGTRDHLGRPLDPKKLFYWPPPYEIGNVLFAETNAKRGASPSMFSSLAITLGAGVGVCLAVLAIMRSLVEKQAAGYLPIDQFVGVGLGFMAAIIALLCTWPRRPVCSYVADGGAAIIKGRRGNPEPRDKKILIFAEMDALFTSITHIFSNGGYLRTAFDIQWRRSGETSAAIRLQGEHRCKDAIPLDGDFSFAVRAQKRWLESLIDRHGRSVPNDRAMVFPCRDSRIKEIRLHRDRVEFVYGQYVDSVAISDIGCLAMKDGEIQFDLNDPNWFSGQGTFRVEYSNLGNATLFLYYLSRLLQSSGKPQTH